MFQLDSVQASTLLTTRCRSGVSVVNGYTNGSSKVFGGWVVDRFERIERSRKVPVESCMIVSVYSATVFHCAQ